MMKEHSRCFCQRPQVNVLIGPMRSYPNLGSIDRTCRLLIESRFGTDALYDAIVPYRGFDVGMFFGICDKSEGFFDLMPRVPGEMAFTAQAGIAKPGPVRRNSVIDLP